MMRPLFLLAALAAPAGGDAPPPSAVAVPAERPAAPAKPPSAKAMELVKLLKGDILVDRMFATLAPGAALQVVATMEAGESTRDYALALAERLPGGRARLAAILTEEFLREMRKTIPELMRSAASSYDRRFSPAEMDQMIHFFSTGTGAKYISLQPEMQAELEPIGRGLGQNAGRAAAPEAIRRAEQEASGTAPDKRT